MESRRNGPQLSSRHDDDDDVPPPGPSPEPPLAIRLSLKVPPHLKRVVHYFVPSVLCAQPAQVYHFLEHSVYVVFHHTK